MGNSTSRVPRADLKSALVIALKAAEMGSEGLPIPGVKASISGILKIIEQEDLREANIETFRGLVDTITEFHTVTVGQLPKNGNIPTDLESAMRVLEEKLEVIPARYNERIGEQSTTRRLKNFISAKKHAEVLNNLGRDLNNVITVFQTALLMSIRLADMKREADRLIDKLPIERKSFYDAHRVRAIDTCQPDTRVSLLEDVAKWAEDTDSNSPRILWLNGRAGVGKSTVAKTLAKGFYEQNTLGGSFMFSKPNGVVDGSKVFTTLAYQLAHHLPDFRDHLAAAIRAKEAAIEAEIPQQFENLLSEPLSKLQLPPITVIILDAVDECASESLTPVLESIIENITHLPFLRFVITSRPESAIREVLQRFPERIQEINMSDIPASEDIANYLRARLGDVYGRLVRKGDQNPAWPDSEDVASLVDMADNLFIFAATAVRFIGDEWVANPRDRLKIILGSRHVGQEHPFSGLDIMYQEILRNALPEGKDDVHERFQAVLGAIVMSYYPFSVNSLATFLAPSYSSNDIKHSLKFLHSVVIVPEDDATEGLQVYHKSFADFITDQKRCALLQAYLDPLIQHEKLCLRHLEMAELISDNLFSDNSQIGASFQAKAPRPSFNAPIRSLGHHLLLHETHAFKRGKEGVSLQVLYRAQALSRSMNKYVTYTKALETRDDVDHLNEMSLRDLDVYLDFLSRLPKPRTTN